MTRPAEITPETTLETTAEFVAAWQRWRHERLSAATAPLGLASLVSTTWLTENIRTEVEDVAGHWHAEDADAVGTGLAGSGYTTPEGRPADDQVRLDAGSELVDGHRRLRLHVRDGSPALRVYDAAADGLTSLQGIDAYPPDSAWVVAGRIEAGGEPRRVSAVDGYTTIERPEGSVVFTLNGQEHRLALRKAGSAYSVVFGDATNGSETYRFRFLRVEAPDEAGGPVVVDFNRAYLPPCAFSDQYVCPLPPPGNRLEIAIRAGERRLLRRADDRAVLPEPAASTSS